MITRIFQTAARIQLLDSIGFNWEGKQRRKKRKVMGSSGGEKEELAQEEVAQEEGYGDGNHADSC